MLLAIHGVLRNYARISLHGMRIPRRISEQPLLRPIFKITTSLEHELSVSVLFHNDGIKIYLKQT